jgi:hypothetical protein
LLGKLGFDGVVMAWLLGFKFGEFVHIEKQFLGHQKLNE